MENTTELVNNDQAEYQRLFRFATRVNEKFAFAIATYQDSRVRDELVQQLESEATQNGCPVAILNLRETELDVFLPDEFVDAVQPQTKTLLVLGLERFLLDPFNEVRTAPSIQGLNVARDSYPTRLPIRVIFWLTKPAAKALSGAAHDLYDVAVTFFAFESKQLPAPIGAYGEKPYWMRSAPEENHEKLQQEKILLEALFRQATNTNAKADHALRIGQLAESLGNYSEAEDWWSRAKLLFEENNNTNGGSRVLLNLARLKEATGALDQAMNLFEQLKDMNLPETAPYNRAWGGIADIYQAQGDLDKALEIREKQLPVFQKLGEKRLYLLGQTDIAIILLTRRQQGDYARAIELLRSALASAREMRIPEEQAILSILERHGEEP